MENIYIDMREQGFTLSNHFKKCRRCINRIREYT